MQSIPNNIYYPPNTEYDLVMTKYPFHDSGIADENLSDETGSIEEELTNKENQLDDNDKPKKPSQSYLEIIAEAILKSPNRMMQLYEIYNYFQQKYRYFAEDVNKSWRNSVRHNLSLNECFVKAGRGTNGKGHFWRIHELAEEEFKQGRFRRRRYRQQMHHLHMQNSPVVHHPSYGHQGIPSFYPTSAPPANSYYMCSPSPPSYSSIYSTPNTSSEMHSISSPIPHNISLPPSTPTNYSFYDPYSTSYYPGHYHSMASSYASPNQSVNFDN